MIRKAGLRRGGGKEASYLGRADCGREGLGGDEGRESGDDEGA